MNAAKNNASEADGRTSRRWFLLPVVPLFLTGLCGLAPLACGECLADLRVVTVEDAADCLSQKVQIVRLHRLRDEMEPSARREWLRNDAREIKERSLAIPPSRIPSHVDGEWLNGFLDAQSRDPVMAGLRGQVSDASSTSPDRFYVSVLEYRTPCEFLPGKWWASYAPGPGTAPRLCEFRLTFAHDVAVMSTSSAGWEHQTTGTAPWRHRWVWRREPGEPAVNPAAPWVVAGAPASWLEIGEQLAERLRNGAPEQAEAPAGLAIGTEITSHRVALLMDPFRTFRREPPSGGFEARAVDQTRADRAGNCKDLSLLLLNDLTSQQLPAYVVFRATALSSLTTCIPCPYVFDHVLVALPARGGAWFLDPYAGQREYRAGVALDKRVQTLDNQLLVAWNPNARVPARATKEMDH